MKIAQNSPDLIQTWINVVFPPHNGFCLRCYLQEAQSQSGQEQKWKKLDQVYCAWNESKKEKLFIMEGFQKLKWKFRMAFAMNGGGVSRAIKVFWRKKMFENHLESLPDCQNAFCT